MIRLLNMVVVTLLLSLFVMQVDGHGRLLKPPGRATAEVSLNNTACRTHYDDNALFCGGQNTQWAQNGGHCGLCGDDFSLPRPRPHEFNGKYGKCGVVKEYRTGQRIIVTVEITAAHKGHFTFQLCNLEEANYLESEDCFNKNRLLQPNGEEEWPLSDKKAGKYHIALVLPAKLKCCRCVLRWHYETGNSWGKTPENFRACADIRIGKKSTCYVPDTYTIPEPAVFTTLRPLVEGSKCKSIGAWKDDPQMEKWCRTTCSEDSDCMIKPGVEERCCCPPNCPNPEHDSSGVTSAVRYTAKPAVIYNGSLNPSLCVERHPWTGHTQWCRDTCQADPGRCETDKAVSERCCCHPDCPPN